MADKNIELKLKGVRLSFTDGLFEPKEGKNNDGSPNGKFYYATNFLIDKTSQADIIKMVRDAMRDAKKATFGDKAVTIKPDAMCLKDGEPIDPDTVTIDEATGQPVPGTGTRVALYDGYAGQMYISANKNVKSKDAPNPVQLLGPRKTAKDAQGNPCFPTVTEKDGLLYAGAYVDAIIRVYGLDATGKDYPSRINASLEAVKFVRHGEAFGAKKVDAQSAFDEEDEDELVGAGPGGSASAGAPAVDEFGLGPRLNLILGHPSPGAEHTDRGHPPARGHLSSRTGIP